MRRLVRESMLVRTRGVIASTVPRPLTTQSITPAPFDPLVEHRLMAKLAEYEMLTQEIRDRSEFQQRIQQIHVTALSVLVGTSLIKAGGMVNHWLLLLIPFESSMFGIQWMDHASYRRRIRRYVKCNVERTVNEIVNQGDVGGRQWMQWELSDRGYKYVAGAPLDSSRRLYRRSHGLAFFWPSALFLALIGGYAVANAPYLNHWWKLRLVAHRTRDLLPVSEGLADVRWTIVVCAFTIGMLIFLGYIKASLIYWQTTRDDAEGEAVCA